jgi:hypothetical protein
MASVSFMLQPAYNCEKGLRRLIRSKSQSGWGGEKKHFYFDGNQSSEFGHAAHS